jgi:uncharacterized DUF497 family protein
MFTKRLHFYMFEWDEAKRLTNLARHAVDFADVDLVFDGRPLITAPSYRNNENRFVSTAEISGNLYSVVWMWRGRNQRIISFRRASNAEEKAYRRAHS